MAKVSIKHSGARGISLEIPDRAFVVVTGPVGCGKTSLLRSIAGLEDIAQGEVFVGERRADDLKPGEREVAIVFPSDALYPTMSVRQNIAFGLKQRKFSQTEIERRVQDAAVALGVEELLERRPRDLSAVQRQRVSIARAIARQPKVLLCDEPLAQFDAGTRAQLRADLRKLHERLETTVIYATRDAAEALALGQRIVVMRDGVVEQEGPVPAVYAAPVNLFVAGFLGAPPMNFLHGTLKLERDALRFREAGEGTIDALLPLSERAAASEFADKPVVLGIRPEEVEIVQAEKGQEPANSFPALVDFIETVGAETTLHLQTGAHTIVARSAGTVRDQPAGRRVRFQFDSRRAHLFDPDSTRRIAEP